VSTATTYMRLEVISGVAPGSTLVVEDELVIGRHATGAGRLSEDEEISRQHARISREGAGNYAIEDLGSSNGTFVNGLKIQSPRVLDVGDSIETGATTMVVRAIVSPESAEAAAEAPATPASAARAAPTVFARVPVVAEAPVPPGPAGQIPPPALKLEIDFDAREARIALGEGGETVRLVFTDGAWRVG
jgi:pSer/pThr/pTyr-binding forkhead associated (FHA) protein